MGRPDLKLTESIQTLRVFDLQGNCIQSDGGEHLAFALRGNRVSRKSPQLDRSLNRTNGLCLTLRKLNLGNNDLNDEGVYGFGDLLDNNRAKKLTTLILQWNRIGDQGARSLAEGLKTNEVS